MGFGLVLIALGAVVALVKAALNLLATPWPWLALGIYVLYKISIRLLAMHSANRASIAVLEVVAAQLDGDEMRLDASLDRLASHDDEPEAALLLSAHHLQRARFDLASAALKRLDGRAGPMTSPHNLVLRFPGMGAPLSLTEPKPLRDVVATLNEHIQTLMTAPARLLAGVNHPALERHLADTLQRVDEHERERQKRLEAERRATEETLRIEAEEQAERVRTAAAERDARLRREAAEREQAAAERATTKIVSAKTSAGRRSALQTGLEAVVSPALRQHLLLVAARAEINSVLTKAASLKTTKAKRRHLEDALAALRADDVPDELQATEIALVEEALVELGQ